MFLLAFATLVSCGLEPLLSQPFTGEEIPELPAAQPTEVRGSVPALPGATVTLWTLTGEPLDLETTAGGGGGFLLSVPAQEKLPATKAVAALGERAYWGLVPQVKKKESVLEPATSVDLGAEIPGMSELSPHTTLVTILFQRLVGEPDMPADAMAAIVQPIRQRLDEGVAELTLLRSMVERILEAAPATGSGEPPFVSDYAGSETSSPLDVAFLARHPVDYDADGVTDTTTDAFDAALEAVVSEEDLVDEVEGIIDEALCYPEDSIRVVFLVELRQDAPNGNCEPIDPFKWADDKKSSSMFLTGGIHEDTPICGADRKEGCLTADTVDAANAELGDWNPNIVSMYDDGTHGDAVAGDGVWTLVRVLPYIPTETSPDGKGVRIGYKYTYGLAKQGWTGSEEWPGNRRLLEIEDANGDHLVIRHDTFGDEASNKDKKNLLTPANGGCGVNMWETDKVEGCAHDTREGRIDEDGDCVPDAYPAAPAVAPLSCEETEQEQFPY